MKRIGFIVAVILSTLMSGQLSAQYRKIRINYPSKQLYAEGKVLKCERYSKAAYCDKSFHRCRRVGEWRFYFDGGGLEHVERYKMLENCDSLNTPDGVWQWFDRSGQLIKEDVYRNGKLWDSNLLDYHSGRKNAGGIFVREGIRDTVLMMNMKEDSLAYVFNHSFQYYSGTSDLLRRYGHFGIEEQLPCWWTPNGGTPDYYNQQRRIRGVGNNIFHQEGEAYDYVGLVLYHQPNQLFREFVTGRLQYELIPRKTYCVKIVYCLSLNSGYTIDRMGVLFTDVIPEISVDSKSMTAVLRSDIDNVHVPQVRMEGFSNMTNTWDTVCAKYIAGGFEKYLTIGRFTPHEYLEIEMLEEKRKSEGGINESAYYLIDKIEIEPYTEACGCEGDESDDGKIDRMDFSELIESDSIKISKGSVLHMRNIQFKYNEAVLLEDAYEELDLLVEFLRESDYKIVIEGHTDIIGSEKHNIRLSLARSKAVYMYLVNAGIDASRMIYEGFGSSVPLVENDTEENRKINRRVEVRVL